MSKVLAAAFPLIQILSAALGLLAWLALEVLSSARYQELPIQVYAIAAVVSLPLTLGLPYLLPNEFRGAPRNEWAGTGPWSASLTIAAWISVISASSGFACTLLAASIGAEGLALVGSWIAAAALVAGSIMATQLARITMSVPKMVLSTWGNLGVPLTALALLPFGASYEVSALSFASVSLAGTLYFAVSSRRQLVSVSAGLRRFSSTLFRQALVLVPHLFFFSILMQGVRLSASLSGSSQALVEAHLLMLLVSIGGTLVASIHSLIVVKVQTSEDANLAYNLSKNSRVYAFLALSGSLVTLFALQIAPVYLEGFPDLNVLGTLAFTSIIPSIVTYYALSGILLRSGATHVLLTASVTSVATFFILSVTLGSFGLDQAVAAYALSMMMLPVTSAALCYFVSRSTRRIVFESLTWMVLAQSPTAVAILVVAFID